MFRSHLLIIALLAVLFNPLCLATTKIDIYQPSHKPAQALIDILAPLYPASQFSTDNQQIIIRGEPAVIAQVQELLLQLDHPTRQFQLEISDHMPSANSKTYSSGTKNFSQQVFLLEENSKLTLSNSTESQQLRGVGPRWFQIKSQPAQQEYLQVKVQAAEQRIYLQLNRRWLHNGELHTFSNTISGPVNQWLSVHGSDTQEDDLRQWRTGPQSLNQLFIKVRKVEVP